jgi:ABC-type sugar transport system substrate-binding protein
MNKIVLRVLGLGIVAAIIIVLVLFARRREATEEKLLVQMVGGQPGAWNLKERMEGFREGVQGTNIVLAKVLYNNENPGTALQVAESAINAYPDLDAFFGSNAFAGPGAALAIQGAKLKKGQVHVVAFDTTEDILDFIEQGLIDCTLAQNTREMGRISIERLVEFAKQYRETKSFKHPPKGEDVIDTGVTVVWPEDVPKYRTKPAQPEKAEAKKPEPESQGPTLRFALVPKSIGHPYWEGVRQGMEEAAQRLGVEAVFQGPPQASIEDQLKVIESLIAQGCNGIGISPNDPDAVNEVIKRAMDKGIAVVTFDSDAPESERLLYIGTDNRQGGRVGAEAMIKILGAKTEATR